MVIISGRWDTGDGDFRGWIVQSRPAQLLGCLHLGPAVDRGKVPAPHPCLKMTRESLTLRSLAGSSVWKGRKGGLPNRYLA